MDYLEAAWNDQLQCSAYFRKVGWEVNSIVINYSDSDGNWDNFQIQKNFSGTGYNLSKQFHEKFSQYRF